MGFQPGNHSAHWFYNGYFLLPKIYNGYFLLPKFYNGYFLLPKTASEMHVALRIVAAKWSQSGVPVVTKYTSGGTLWRDNCQLIGLSLNVLARQAPKNRN